MSRIGSDGVSYNREYGVDLTLQTELGSAHASISECISVDIIHGK
jgi:hypothetical protein